MTLESVAHGAGQALHVVHGMHGRGGSHYNCLLAVEEGDGDGEGVGEGGEALSSTESLRVSGVKWAEQVIPPFLPQVQPCRAGAHLSACAHACAHARGHPSAYIHCVYIQKSDYYIYINICIIVYIIRMT